MARQDLTRLLKIRWRPGQLARHGSSLFAWMLLRAAVQAAIVVLLARELGAKPYGQFVAIIAVASFFTPFTGIGLSNMVVRNGARDPAHMPAYLARAVRWWQRSLLPCIAIAVAVATLLLPAGFPRSAAFAAITSELIAASMTELRGRHRQAQHRINAFGAISAGLPACRLVGLGLLFLIGQDVRTVAVLWIYTASSLAYASALWVSMRAETGSANDSVSEPMAATSGLPFSMAAFAVRLQAEFNKPVLARSGFGLAGTYNVAQRAVDLASLPLSALQDSLWPRLYAQKNPIRQLRRSGLALLALALCCGIIVIAAAPLLPWVLGPSFAAAENILHILAWLPLLLVFRGLINFYVVHRGWMPLIGWAYAIGALVSVVAVELLVPRWGMKGAAIAAYLSEAAMLVALLAGCLRKRAVTH